MSPPTTTSRGASNALASGARAHYPMRLPSGDHR